MVSFVRILAGESLETTAVATSQAFYVLQGKGLSSNEAHGDISWAAGDMVVLPCTSGPVRHSAAASHDSSLYWVTDEPVTLFLRALVRTGGWAGALCAVKTVTPLALEAVLLLRRLLFLWMDDFLCVHAQLSFFFSYPSC